MSERKILIAIPSGNQVPAEFACSLAQLQKVDQCAVAFKIGSLVYTARDELAKTSLECEANYVFWLDSDMTFEPDTLRRMLKTLEEDENIDILSGLYFRRVPPFTPTLFEHLELKDGHVEWSDFSHIPAKPFEVDGCGFGCVLMKADIFREVQVEQGALFTPLLGMGEDLAFCYRARKCGYHIWCDPRIVLGHVGYHIITKDFFLQYQEASHEKED